VGFVDVPQTPFMHSTRLQWHRGFEDKTGESIDSVPHYKLDDPAQQITTTATTMLMMTCDMFRARLSASHCEDFPSRRP
jgi:hypothetical protein